MSRKTERFSLNLAIATLVFSFLIVTGCTSNDDMTGSDNSGQESSGDSTEQEGETEGDSQSNFDSTLSSAAPSATSDTVYGSVWIAGSDNRTLYTFADDSIDQSSCTGTCASVWPPLLAQTASQSGGSFATITRMDGKLQWAFKNQPLYFYSGDAAEGEVAGENLNSKWFVARPDPVVAVRNETMEADILVANGSINAGIDDPAVRRADFDGMSLYIFTRDSDFASLCNAGCAEDWPPLYADRGAVARNGFGLLTRNDGASQWSYNGEPLYFYIGDQKPGDVTGQGVGAEWFVARP